MEMAGEDETATLDPSLVLEEDVLMDEELLVVEAPTMIALNFMVDPTDTMQVNVKERKLPLVSYLLLCYITMFTKYKVERIHIKMKK